MKREWFIEVGVVWNIIVDRLIRRVIKVEDDVWFVGVVVSDLEKRD